MTANNETGTLQDVGAMASICRQHGAVFHTDAVQSFGKEDIHRVLSAEPDLITICAHKFHGPKGAGALYIRSPLRLFPLHHGGSQESDRRPGTENLASIMGLVTAMERFVAPPVFDPQVIRPLTHSLQDKLVSLDGVRAVSPPERLANTVSFVIHGCDSLSMLAALDLEGVCASSGSACSAGSLEPSHVLLAQGYDHASAASFLRFSLGRESCEAEVSHVVRVFESAVRQIRSNSEPA